MSGEFKNLFSTQADTYAKHRLTYPAALFEYIASLAPQRELAWDCGTGNGQAAHGMRAHFDHVIATDAAQRQIDHAIPGDGIAYRVALAERSGLDDDSVDAISIGTAFHWFDHEAFAREAKRVGRNGAVVAAWTYAWSEMPEAPRAAIAEHIGAALTDFWAPEVSRVWGGYGDLYFPFDEVEPPAFEVRRSWTADDWMAYANTWSAVQAHRDAHGFSPVDAAADALREAWGPEPLEIRWPLALRVGHISK